MTLIVPFGQAVHLSQGPSAEKCALGHVVCSVDLGPHSERALKWASGLAEEFNTVLSL